MNIKRFGQSITRIPLNWTRSIVNFFSKRRKEIDILSLRVHLLINVRPGFQNLNHEIEYFNRSTERLLNLKKEVLNLKRKTDNSLLKRIFFNKFIHDLKHLEKVINEKINYRHSQINFFINQKTKFITTQSLIDKCSKCWDEETKRFYNPPFDKASFIQELNFHIETFKPPHNPDTEHGFIEKKDLNPESKIFVRADLHGDLKSLIENIKTLKSEGLIDENYRCKPNVQLVFLGDYGDRGNHTLEVLRLLISLKRENPHQVNIIRGNHESLLINFGFAGREDENFNDFLESCKNKKLLSDFYDTMPLTVYMSEKSEGRREYVQFTHGLFELYVDPSEMLQSPEFTKKLPVSKKGRLSQRIVNLSKDTCIDSVKFLKLCIAADIISQLYEEDDYDNQLTKYNWGDMGHSTHLGDAGQRKWKLSPQDVKAYLRVCSPNHPVKMIFRGHEHLKQHHTINSKTAKEKIIVSTMPIGMDTHNYYIKNYPNQMDTCYILTTAGRIRNWSKQAYLRNPGESVVEITPYYPIRSSDV